jgi:uncharacterized protein (DUF433 family)
VIKGTGVKVWLLVDVYQQFDEDWEKLRERYDWLDEEQLRAALDYYRALPADIDAKIKANRQAVPEDVRREWEEYLAREHKA